MKTLVLIRHAKSSWNDPGLPDHERPLNKRGKRDAPEMGRRLVGRRLMPDVIISSTARRAVMTAEAIADSLEYPRDGIVLEERLYLASSAELVEFVGGIDDRHNRVIIVSHNPGISGAAERLLHARIDNLPTCATVYLKYDVRRWADAPGSVPVDFDIDFPGKER